MKVLIITQARLGSSRLPSKILRPICGRPMLQVHLDRLLRSQLKTDIVLATTYEAGIDEVLAISQRLAVRSFQGDSNDVLDRFYHAALPLQPDIVVRVTADCPLIDGELVDKLIAAFGEKKLDYLSNTLDPFYPDGEDVEVFSWNALERAWDEASIRSDREHVTPYIWRNSSFLGKQVFTAENFECDERYNEVRLTVDEPADLESIDMLVQRIGFDAGWRTYADLYREMNNAMSNRSISRNEGYLKTTTEKKNNE